MKKYIKDFFRVVALNSLLFVMLPASAQTSKDTVKLDKPNDAMVLNPGKTNDANAMLTDTGFISKNMLDDITAIQLSKAGRDRGNVQVKKIASLLITDHTTMLNDLRRLASAKHVGTIENQMGGMSSMPAMADAALPEGDDFNATWASFMLTMHVAKILELEDFISVTQDVDIKAVANKALQKIKMHRDLLSRIPGAKAEGPNSVLQ